MSSLVSCILIYYLLLQQLLYLLLHDPGLLHVVLRVGHQVVVAAAGVIIAAVLRGDISKEITSIT